MLLAVVAPRRSLGRVDDVVVQQGRGVQVLENGGEVRQVVALVAAHPGGQDEEQGPHPFAAAQQDMPPHLGDQRHVGPEIGVQCRIDGGKVLLQGGLQQLFGGGIHVNKLAYIPRDVNLLD